MEDYGIIDQYDKHGCLLTKDQIIQIATKRGLCYVCGRRTHNKRNVLFGGNQPLTNDTVYNGLCIEHNADKVPPAILDKWKKRHKPSLQQVATAVANAQRFVAKANVNVHAHATNSPPTSPGRKPPQSVQYQSARIPRQKHHDMNQDFLSERAMKKGTSSASGIGATDDDSAKAVTAAATATTSSTSSSRKEVVVPPSQDPLLGNLPDEFAQKMSSKKMGGSKKVSKKKMASSRRPSDASMNVSQSSSMGGSSTSSSKKIASSSRHDKVMKDTSEQSLRSVFETNVQGSFSNHNLDTSNSTSNLNNSSRTSLGTSLGTSSRGVMAPDDFQFQSGSHAPEDIAMMLQEYTQNVEDVPLLRSILHCCRNEYDGNAAILVDPLRELMLNYEFEPRIMDLACGAVWRMSVDNGPTKQMLVESGTVEMVMDTLNKCRNDVDCSKWVLGAMESIALDIQAKEYVSQKNAVGLVLETLQQHSTVAGVLEWSCRCLYVLLNHVNSEEDDFVDAADLLASNVLSIEDLNGISTIVQSMKIHEKQSTVQLIAVELLWCLLDDSDEESMSRIVRKFVEADLVSLLTRLLFSRSSTAELYDKVAELLCVIASFSKDDPSVIAGMSECVSPVLSRMQQDLKEKKIQRAGLRILAVVAVLGNVPVQKLRDKKAPDLVIRALKLLTDGRSVTSGLLILWRLSSLNRTTDLLELKHVSSALAVMKTIITQESYAIHNHGAIFGFVANMAATPGLEMSTIPLATLMNVSFNNVSQSNTAKQIATDCLPYICLAFPEFVPDVVEFMVTDHLLTEIGNGIFDSVGPLLYTLRVAESKVKLTIPLPLTASVVNALSGTSDPTELKAMVDLFGRIISVSKESIAIDAATVQCLVDSLDEHQHDLFLCQGILSTMAPALLLSPTGVDSDSVADAILAYATSPAVSDADDIQEAASMALWALLSSENPACTSDTLSRIFGYTITIFEQFVGDSAEDFDADLVETFCGVLAAVGSRARVAPIVVSQPDMDTIVSIIYSSMERMESSEIPRLVLEALYHFCLLDEGLLVQCGVIVAIADIFQNCKAVPVVLETGFAVLAQLASSENVSINLSIAYSDGIDSLLHGMSLFPLEQGLQTEGCRAFAHLSTEAEIRMVISEQGGIDLIASSLTVHKDCEMLVFHGCSALLNLTSDAPDHTIEGFDIVRVVVEILEKYDKNTSIERNCLGILQNVSMKGAHAKDAIARCNGLEAVMRSIKPDLDSPDVLERAFTTLWSLCVLSENRERIQTIGGVESAVNAMLAFVEYEGVQQQGCGCLCTLAMNTDVCESIVASGGCTALLFAMRVHFSSLDVQREAIRAVEIVYDSKPNDGSVGSTSEKVNAILSAMQRFPDDETLQTRACNSLSSLLSYNPSAGSQEVDDVKRLVQHAAARFPVVSDQASRVESLLA